MIFLVGTMTILQSAHWIVRIWMRKPSSRNIRSSGQDFSEAGHRHLELPVTLKRSMKKTPA
jgi:hypothetical protein